MVHRGIVSILWKKINTTSIWGAVKAFSLLSWNTSAFIFWNLTGLGCGYSTPVIIYSTQLKLSLHSVSLFLFQGFCNKVPGYIWSAPILCKGEELVIGYISTNKGIMKIKTLFLKVNMEGKGEQRENYNINNVVREIIYVAGIPTWGWRMTEILHPNSVDLEDWEIAEEIQFFVTIIFIIISYATEQQ